MTLIGFQKQMKSTQGADALFKYATEGIFVVNERGVIVNLNPSAERLFGYSKEELIGQTIETLVPKRFSSVHKKQREDYSENPHARSMGSGMDLYGQRKDGSEFPLEISLSPYQNDDGKFTIAFIVDITIRKQAEEKLKNYSFELERQVKNRTLILEEAIQELEKTKRDLKKSLDREMELNEMKSRFVAMASHEFRTPLATMMSSLSLVTKYAELNDKEKQDRHVTKIKSSIINLTDILNDLLSVSKLEEGKVENYPVDVNLKDLILDIVAEIQPIAKPGQHIDLTYTGKDIAVVDKKVIKHVLFNLLSNAIKFSPENAAIQLQADVQNAYLKLVVSDQGIGIAQEDQEHLFERFFRGQNVTHIQGTGLGLNIVGRYVEMMNGHIDFESTENKGTTFTITIPQ